MNLQTHVPATGELAYTFGGRAAVAEIKPGELLRVYTQDCFGGAVTRADTLPSQACGMPYLNPITGPFHVAGAEPGDTLAVHLIDMTPARDWGVSSTFPHFGALTATASLQPALPERVWLYPIDVAAGVVHYTATSGDYRLQLPLAPMLGTVGVAPSGGEARTTLTAGAHGGNMDLPQLRAGTTLYLPVYEPGAGLALGDGHARQGDGEACGVAVETAMYTTITVEVIKGEPIAGPRLETDRQLMSIGLARPLDDAYRIAHVDLIGWVASLTGLDTLDAYQLVAQAGQARIGNVCDPTYSIAAAIDKKYVDGAAAFDGVHRRLRALATPPRGLQ